MYVQTFLLPENERKLNWKWDVSFIFCLSLHYSNMPNDGRVKYIPNISFNCWQYDRRRLENENQMSFGCPFSGNLHCHLNYINVFCHTIFLDFWIVWHNGSLGPHCSNYQSNFLCYSFWRHQSSASKTHFFPFSTFMYLSIL